MKVKLSRNPFKRARQIEELQMKNAGNVLAIIFAGFMIVLGAMYKVFK